MIRKTKQNWEIGGTVNVGFVRDLKVVAKIPTPGDWAPDAYLLFGTKGFYEFVPHNGLRALTNAAEIRAMVANASERLAA